MQVMARKELERDGYTVHTAVRSVQKRGPIWISQSTDIFNAFDLIATRMAPPQPLRFIQVTTLPHVSERVRKVDPIPVDTNLASVEIWAYVGGRKRLDRRYRGRRVWLPRNYFQVYYKSRNWEPDHRDRIFPADANTGSLPQVEATVTTQTGVKVLQTLRRRGSDK